MSITVAKLDSSINPFDSWQSLALSLYMTLAGYAVLVGVPVIIGEKGIEKIIELDLSNQSKKEFQKSVEAVEQLVKKCKKLLV